MFKYIIISILGSITNLLPISYPSHIYISQNLFNTKIFDNQQLNSFLNISHFITILIIFHKPIIKFFLSIIKSLFIKNKKSIKSQNKYLRLLLISSTISTSLYFFIPHHISNIKVLALSFILTAIFLFSSKNKNGIKKYSDITYVDSLIIGFSTILTFIPSLSPLCINLFVCSRRKFDKINTIKYSYLTLLPILLINSYPGIISLINNQEYFISYSICILISVFISLYIYDYFCYLYLENKLSKLAFYCLFLSAFLLFWFR